MAEPDGIVMIVGAYASVEDARQDFEAIKLLKKEKFLGDYESALFHKDAEGTVKIIDTDATERGWGAKVGIVTGAAIGLIFPPSILAMGAAGAGVGAIAGNFMRGLKRKDVQAIGEMLDEGTAGVVMVGETTIEQGMDRLMKRAAKVIKQDIDAQAEALKAQVDETIG